MGASEGAAGSPPDGGPSPAAATGPDDRPVPVPVPATGPSPATATDPDGGPSPATATDPDGGPSPAPATAPRPVPRTRLEGRATAGGRVYQAGRDLHLSEVHHHHGGPAGPLAVVEPVLPAGEAVAEVFVGRGVETGAVLAVLDPAVGATGMVVVSSVAGLAGIGKTALARSCAAEAVARGWYPGGAVFVDLNGYAPDPADRVMPAQVFAPMLHALGLRGPVDAAGAGQAAQYHRLLAERAAEGRPVLLVLDNASGIEQTADLLPRSRVHRTLITSRHTLATRGSRTLELGTLAAADARTLVEEQYALLAPDGTGTRDDPEGTERLCRLCGHLPLALHIATALLAREPDRTPGELADELARAHRRLDVLDDGERAVRAAFELSYLRLTPEQALLFRLLPLNPGPHLATDTAARLVDVPEDDAVRLIRELARAHVVERAGPGLWRQHDLMRAYAIELLGRLGDDQAEASNRLLDHYVALAADAVTVLRTGPDHAPRAFHTPEEALDWFDREHPNIQAAISMAATFGDSDGAVRLQEGLIALYAHRRQTTEWEGAARSAERFAREADDVAGRSGALREVALALEAAGRADDTARAAETLLRFQRTVVRRARAAPGSLDCAELLEHALDAVAEGERLLGGRDEPLVRTLRMEVARAVAARRNGGAFEELGVRALREAAEPPPGSGRPQGEALAWAGMALQKLRFAGRIHNSEDDGEGVGLYAAERALAMIPPTTDPEEAESWREVCDVLARYAVESTTGGAEARASDEFTREGWWRTCLPAVARAHEIAVAACARIGDRAAQTDLLTGLADESFASGDYERAVGCRYRLAVAAVAAGDEAGEGEALAGVAHAALLLEHHQEAADAAERAVPLLLGSGLPAVAGRALAALANARHRLGDLAAALEAASRAVSLAHSADDPQGRAAALLVLGLAQRDTGAGADAHRSWAAALALTRALADPSFTARAEIFLISVGFPLADP
ncbi:ATP-binding protein [Streptomyces wedmorensis]